MSNNLEVRKLPKSSIIAIVLVVVIGFGYYFLSSGLREAKLAEILAPLGHKNVTNITVFKTSKVEDPDTRKKGLLYSLQFTDLDLQKECKGFVYQDNKRKFQKDIDCK